MRALFWLLAIFALAVAVALGAQLNDGYVLLVFPPWRVEINLNLFIVAIVLLFGMSYAVLRGLSVTFGLPQRVREYKERVRQDKANAVFQDAVRLLFEGRFGQALKKSVEAHGAGVAPGLSALVAARSAQRMRESMKQQGWLERAKIDDPRTEAATLMLEAEMLNESRRFDEAVVVLKKLQAKHGRHLAALRLELRARQGCGDWAEVLRLARQLEKRDTLLPELAAEIKLQAHLHNLENCSSDAGQLEAYLKDVPKAERNSRLAVEAARRLMALEANEEAQALIETYLDSDDEEDWNDDLVALYGKLGGDDLNGRIARAEKWLRQHPEDGELLLALGRLCVRQRLWGKAQSYLEASRSVRESREAHLELARLFDQLGREDEANRLYRESARFENI
ncbi:MAG TPA: heme biosynthesis protein HemY [Rhodocyclaceae bacterium]|nr:heme biosynthesis protein HemY [Rhodocyclaceae bacterium]